MTTEYKSSLPNIDWNISSIHTVDVALNQAARVRQMLRTRKLQLQLETDIKTLAWRRRSNESNRANLQSTKSAGVQMMTTSPRKSDGCPQTRINELEKKLSDLQQTTEDHADLSAALASEESKERVRERHRKEALDPQGPNPLLLRRGTRYDVYRAAPMVRRK